MTTRKSIWILIGMIVIVAWVLGSVTQVGAQTYTVKCRETGHFPQVHRIEVGDVPDHILSVGETIAVRSCDDGSVATSGSKFTVELIKGSGKAQGYTLMTFEDGSTLWEKYQQTVAPDPNGKTVTGKGTYEYIKGTGRFEGIQGSGTITFKRLAPLPGAGVQFYTDSIGTYTLPSK